jgi:hypothetical protein
MTSPTAVFTIGDFIRRVVESLLHGERRGQSLCARCLVKVTKDNLDRSYAKPEIVRVMEEIFAAPGALTVTPAATCGGCARKKVACLGGSAAR